MLIKKTKEMTDSERIAVENSNNQYLRTLTYAPIGMIVPFGGDTAPSAFLVCDGSALDTTEYEDLFNVIGYTYGGTGDIFYIPNLSYATIDGISFKYIIKTANGITQQDINEILVNAVPKIAIDSGIGFMDAVICVKEGAALRENGIPSDSDYVYKTIDTGSYAGKENILPGGIAARDDNGNLWTGEPVDDVDCVNKKYADDGFVDATNSCVPKIQTTWGPPYDNVITVNESAETDENGLPLNSEYQHTPIDNDSVDPQPGWIVRRNSNGNVRTGVPVKDQECVPYSMYKALLERVEALEEALLNT